MNYADLLRMRQNIRYMLYRFKYAEISKKDIPESQWATYSEPTDRILEAHLANCIAAGVDPKDVEFMASEMRKEHKQPEAVK